MQLLNLSSYQTAMKTIDDDLYYLLYTNGIGKDLTNEYFSVN